MSFARYEHYKDSGVEWLGEVPGHWSNVSLRWVSTRYSGGTPDKLNHDYWTDGTIPWLNSGAVNQGLISEPSTFITQEAYENSSAKWIPAGALVMALAGQGKTKGIVAQLKIPSTCNQSMAAIVPNEEMAPRFLYWWLASNYQNIRNMAGGDLRDGLNLELLGSIPCPLPAIEEQATISTFLDRETAKIDALVAEQQRLIELLKEKRQAVISNAVTKGLNPDVPMRDSGIEWLGEVPAHWRVGAIKYFVLAKNGSIKTGPFGSHLTSLDMQSGTIKVYNQRSVIDSDFEAGENFISKDKFAELSSFETFPGDLLITTRGTIGRAAILPLNAERGILHPCLLRLQPDNAHIDTVFLKTLIQDSDLMKTQLSYLSNATTIEVIYSYTIASVIIPVPPLAEQNAIMEFLAEQIFKFNELTAEAHRAITLLQERRTALISAAVTGKIDVRGAMAGERETV